MPDVFSPDQAFDVAITGMTCCHHIDTVRAVLDALPDVWVQQVSIGFATLVLDPLGNPEALIETLRATGHSPSFRTRHDARYYGFLNLSRVGESSSFHGNGAPFTCLG